MTGTGIGVEDGAGAVTGTEIGEITQDGGGDGDGGGSGNEGSSGDGDWFSNGMGGGER